MSSSDTQLRRTIHEETALPVNRRGLRLDWRGMWGVATMFVTILVALVTTLTNTFFPYGVMIILVIALAVIVLVIPLFDNMTTSLLTKLYLMMRFDLGQEAFASDVHKEVLDDGKAPKITKRLPKIEFIPFRPPADTYESDNDEDEPILGIARDVGPNTYSAVFQCTAWSLFSDSFATREHRLAFFAELLDSMAELSSPVVRFSWRVQTTLGSSVNPKVIVQQVREDAGFKANPLLDASTLDAGMRALAREDVNHQISFIITLNPARAGDAIKKLGSPEAVLYHYCIQFYERLQLSRLNSSPLGVQAGRFLSYNELLMANRLILDPVFAHPYIERMRADDEELIFENQRPAWPKFFSFADPERARLGETLHSGFYTEDMPFGELSSTQLWEILKQPIPKTVTVVFGMIPVRQAEKRARWAANAAYVRQRDTERIGARITQAERREIEETERREAEIAYNMGMDGRVRAYIDVTASRVDELDEYVRDIRSAAIDARMLIEPLTGRQEDGLEVLLSSGRGLYESPFKQ